MGYLVDYIGLDFEVGAKLIQKMELLYLGDDIDAVVGKSMNFLIAFWLRNLLQITNVQQLKPTDLSMPSSRSTSSRAISWLPPSDLNYL